jgi:hypothetical protein
LKTEVDFDGITVSILDLFEASDFSEYALVESSPNYSFNASNNPCPPMNPISSSSSDSY